MKWVITTSYYGRSSQYNRIYRELGRTTGYGTLHIPDEEMYKMEAWLRQKGINIPASSTSWRMKIVTRYWREQQKLTYGSLLPGLPTRIGDKIFHGQIRSIYYHPKDDRPVPEIVMDWYRRWGIPRWERMKDKEPPYQNGLTESKPLLIDAI